MRNTVVTILIIAAVVGVGYVFYSSNYKSNAQKFAECSVDAGKIYDSARQTITANANGYSPAGQNVYYQTTEDAYTRNLESCRELYP